MRVLVTGGAGFIGSALLRHLVKQTGYEVLNLDCLSYSGNLASLDEVAGAEGYRFVNGDICSEELVEDIFATFRPQIVTHLAAESHVDRSIDGPAAFVQTNLVGTYVLLNAAVKYWKSLPSSEGKAFRFHHISTDEVFGSLPAGGLFTETTPYDPRSPYSATKAGSDHLVRAWGHTYGLPVLLTNCSNNFGSHQFPEKLIPLVIIRALQDKSLPIYGRGDQVRDWLYVDDHVRALQFVFERGVPGRTYNVGGSNERANLDVVHSICSLLDEMRPRSDAKSYAEQIEHVADRPGHDQRYAIDSTRIRNELGWEPLESFDSALRKTVEWYLRNESWWGPLIEQHAALERRGAI